MRLVILVFFCDYRVDELVDNVDIDPVVKLRPLLYQVQPAFTFKAQFDRPRFSALCVSVYLRLRRVLWKEDCVKLREN